MKRLFLIAFALQTGLWAGDADAVLKKAEENRAATATTQSRIDALDDESRQFYDEYRRVLSQTEALKNYNDQLDKLIVAQEAEAVSLKRQIVNVEETGRGVLPLMSKMTVALEEFVALDLPFLPKERGERVERLKKRLDQADVTVAEKYRLILEAYGIENEYGRTIEAYQGTLPDGRTVEFFRFGRIGLYYQTLDGKEAGRYNPQTKTYDVMGSNDRGELAKAIRIARKETVPDLIALPLEAPKAAQ